MPQLEYSQAYGNLFQGFLGFAIAELGQKRSPANGCFLATCSELSLAAEAEVRRIIRLEDFQVCEEKAKFWKALLRWKPSRQISQIDPR